jgi:hypothetical protein
MQQPYDRRLKMAEAHSSSGPDLTGGGISACPDTGSDVLNRLTASPPGDAQMPMILDTIDKIARQKQCSVLFLDFHKCIPRCSDDSDWFKRYVGVDWDNLPVRRQVIEWLNEAGVAWRPCGDFAGQGGWMILEGYFGTIYVDVPFDQQDPLFQKIDACFDLTDKGESSRWPGVLFCYLTLEKAMENTHHDEPGYWDNW